MIYKCNNVTNHYMSALTSSVPVKCRADLSGWSGPRSWNLAGNISPDCIIVATIHKHSMSNYWITCLAVCPMVGSRVSCLELMEIYRILHELSFNINFYETSLGNDIKQANGKRFILKWCVQSFYHLFFSVRLLLVLRGHSIFSSPPQRPMTSDFEGFLYQILSITFFDQS